MKSNYMNVFVVILTIILLQSSQVNGSPKPEDSLVDIIKNRNKMVEEIIGNQDEVKERLKAE